jgi:hypothetical protein
MAGAIRGDSEPIDVAEDPDGGERMDLIPMKCKKAKHIRSWPRKKKVSANLSKNFPWEIILDHLRKSQKGVYALVMLQLVDKNLRQVIRNQVLMWTDIFKRMIYKRSFYAKVMDDYRFPRLLLHNSAFHTVPVHVGLVPGDSHYVDTPDREQEFCRYVRKAVALKFGKHCSLCGARRSHYPYWGLGMRVCNLCLAKNSLSSARIFQDYGLHYMDLIRAHYQDVYYYEIQHNDADMRVSFTNITIPKEGLTYKDMKSLHCMMWKPHLEKVVDLDQIRTGHIQRKQSAQFICALLRRRWVFFQREKAGGCKRPSIDTLLIHLNQNEKRRLLHPYGRCSELAAQIVLGSGWAFHWPKENRIERLHGVRTEWVWSKMNEWFTRVPRVCV